MPIKKKFSKLIVKDASGNLVQLLPETQVDTSLDSTSDFPIANSAVASALNSSISDISVDIQDTPAPIRYSVAIYTSIADSNNDYYDEYSTTDIPLQMITLETEVPKKITTLSLEDPSSFYIEIGDMISNHFGSGIIPVGRQEMYDNGDFPIMCYAEFSNNTEISTLTVNERLDISSVGIYTYDYNNNYYGSTEIVSNSASMTSGIVGSCTLSVYLIREADDGNNKVFGVYAVYTSTNQNLVPRTEKSIVVTATASDGTSVTDAAALPANTMIVTSTVDFPYYDNNPDIDSIPVGGIIYEITGGYRNI